MKKNDIMIISHLRENGRIRLTELSRRTGLPVSTIHERIKKHIERNLLKPAALLQFEKLGYHCRAHILISVEQEEKEKLISMLR